MRKAERCARAKRGGELVREKGKRSMRNRRAK
ncbi:hypothetical protein A2U01_0100825, partial [Trifolium medium]|nr:hypothetical protein [Trifolium medium]